MAKKMTTRRVAFMGLLITLSVVLSFLESMIPLSGILPPGVKLGLSNIAVMYCLFFVGRYSALALAVFKGLFSLITRGAMAGLLSTCGGVLSVLVMIILMRLFKDKISYLTLSILGALAHNLAQILVASVIAGSAIMMYYFPILVISAVAMGILTGSLLRVLMPYLKKLDTTFK